MQKDINYFDEKTRQVAVNFNKLMGKFNIGVKKLENLKKYKFYELLKDISKQNFLSTKVMANEKLSFENGLSRGQFLKPLIE